MSFFIFPDRLSPSALSHLLAILQSAPSLARECSTEQPRSSLGAA